VATDPVSPSSTETSGSESAAPSPESPPTIAPTSAGFQPADHPAPSPQREPEPAVDATLVPGVATFELKQFSPSSEKYNPEQSRDKARANITYWLLILLTVLFLGAFAAFFSIREAATFANLKTLLEMLITPLIVLVSAATGFYFGANSSTRSNGP
jgi:hypothetical protein